MDSKSSQKVHGMKHRARKFVSTTQSS